MVGDSGLWKARIGDSCNLPAGASASCTLLADCPYLLKLIGNLQLPLANDIGLLIRESFFCGGDGAGGGLGCCPTSAHPATTPTDNRQCALQNRLEASCTVYSQCPPFVQMMANLQKPLPPAVPAVVRSSFLCGATKDGDKMFPNICCPAEAITQPSSGKRILADPETCGRSIDKERIVGGQDAYLGEYPWLVNLGYLQNGNGPYYKVNKLNNSSVLGLVTTVILCCVAQCGGVLIGRRYVVTAAHCVTDLPRSYQLTTVRAGEYDLGRERECQQENPGLADCNITPQNFNIEEIVPHPQYNKPYNYLNDIAIIKLSEDIIENTFVSPACLPYEDNDVDYFNGGNANETVVAGWGATHPQGRNPADVLQRLAVPVTDSRACRDIYKPRGGTLDISKQVCAGAETDQDSCVGDSGSGLMQQRDTQTFIIGVVSFGPKMCGTKGVPGVYTRINSYIDWMLETVEKID